MNGLQHRSAIVAYGRVQALAFAFATLGCDSAPDGSIRRVGQVADGEERAAASSPAIEFTLRDSLGSPVARAVVPAGTQQAFSVKHCGKPSLAEMLSESGYRISLSEVVEAHASSTYVTRFKGQSLIGDVWAREEHGCLTMDFRVQLADKLVPWRVYGRQAQDSVACRHEDAEGARRRALELGAPCWFSDHTGFPTETRESLRLDH